MRQRRRHLQISQEELAFRSKLDRTYISGLERGKRNPSLTVLAQVAIGLGITVSELLNRLEEEAQNGKD